MSTHDLKGRPYARMSELKAGDRVQVDGDFTCIRKNSRLKVASDSGGLFIPCRQGRHYLDGQLDDNTDALVGVYHK